MAIRIVQAGFMPVVALGFAVAPVAGQNFGARQAGRVRDTFSAAVAMAIAGMIAFTVLCHAAPDAMLAIFTTDAQVIAVGAEYLRIASWNFVGAGIVFVSSSMFQAMGNTMPSLITSCARLLMVVIPAFVLASRPGFVLSQLWYVSVIAGTLQMAINLVLLRHEFRVRLNFDRAETAPRFASAATEG